MQTLPILAAAIRNHARRGFREQYTRLCTTEGTSVPAVHTFPLQLGMLVSVKCADPHKGINATTSPRDDVLQVQGGEDIATSVSDDGTKVVVELLSGQQRSDSPHQGTSATSSSSSSTQDIQLQLPQRYCSFHAVTAGGPIALQHLQEASLRLDSNGGPVHLRKARCTDASVDTQGPKVYEGGEIQAGELSASRVTLRSGGGAISAKRLFGLDVDLNSCRGSIQLGALYATRCSIATERGSLSLSHGACSGLLSVDTEGGAITVEGLEGNASLISGGGPIKVHLHERFGSVFVDSGGGDVFIALSPEVWSSLQVQAHGGVAVDPALKVTGELDCSTLTGELGGMASPAASSSSSSGGSTDRGGGVRLVSAEERVIGPSHTSIASDGPLAPEVAPRAASASVNASRLWRSAGAAGVAQEDPQQLGLGGLGLGQGQSKLVVNAGAGRVELGAKGWMDGLREKMAGMQGRG